MPGYAALRSHSADTRLALHVCLGVRVSRLLPGAVVAQAKTASRLGFPTPLPSPVAGMSPPVADQPAALPRAPSVLTMAAPFGDPGLTLTLLYSTGTARSSSAAGLRVKGFALLITVLTLMCSSPPFGFALPPTPEPIEINQARSKPGGFLRGPFQVAG